MSLSQVADIALLKELWFSIRRQFSKHFAPDRAMKLSGTSVFLDARG